VFFSIIPLAVVVGAVGGASMRRFGPVERSTDEARSDGDVKVSLAFVATIGIGVFLLALTASNPAVFVFGSLAGAVVAVPALRRLLPHGFFTAQGPYPAVLTCRFLAAAMFILVDSFVPLAAARIHGSSPLVQGFIIVGAAVSWTLGQILIARWPDTRPDRAVLVGFVLLFVGGVLVTPVLWAGWPLWTTFVAWAIGGLGMGILYNPSTVAAMSFATDGREGIVSSQIRLTDSLGFSVMYGVGGAMVAIADRGGLTLRSALIINFVLSGICGIAGMRASRGVRHAV
jgi:MFS family permease